MRVIITFCLSMLCFICQAQDTSYNKKMVDTLTSPALWGRGYTKSGMTNAVNVLQSEFRTLGILPLNGKNHLQKFSVPVNTFPGKMDVILNGKRLIPGVDFIVGPDSKAAKVFGTLEKKDSATYIDKKNKIIVTLEKKLTWSVSQTKGQYTIIQIDKNRIKEIPKNIDLTIETLFLKKFEMANIAGVVAGTEKPDSFLFITAHYDHLGGMGADTYFPGANDNASGVALLLSLAKYYALNPQRYSIAFVLFAGEEIGLMGSKYYTENPMVPLKQIRFLTNTDLAGTGSEGITVVNATIFPKEFALMNKINDANKYLVKINARGEAANSDHYWFTKKGVPAFFFYTLGGIAAYHDVFDKASTLPLTEQADLQELLIKFNSGLQGVK
jgi:aminopeptidase YwaD